MSTGSSGGSGTGPQNKIQYLGRNILFALLEALDFQNYRGEHAPEPLKSINQVNTRHSPNAVSKKKSSPRPPSVNFWIRQNIRSLLLQSQQTRDVGKHWVDVSCLMGGGPKVVVSTAAFHAIVRGSFPALGGLKETKMFLSHRLLKLSIVGSLRTRPQISRV